MQRVLFVIDQLASGGAPRSVLKLTRAMLAQGVSVTLVALSERLGLDVPEGAEVRVVPFTPRGRREKLHRYRLHARRLDAFLAEHPASFDLVVANLHQAHQVVSRSCLADRAWLCIRSDPRQELLSNKQGWRRRIKRRKVCRLYGDKRLIVLSETNRQSLASIGCRPREVRVIPNVMELERLQVMMRDPIAEPEWAGRDFCLYVGRLAMTQKRLDRLLRGYLASGTDLPLVLIGDGDRASVEREIHALNLEDRVTLLGARDNPYPYMRRARLLMLSSDYEGLPNVLLEALACGTPVVSTDCLSGPSDILQGELRRGLVPLDDVEAFGAAMSDLLADPPAIPAALIEPYTPASIVARYRALGDD
ncbi:glycosyltransferase [Halomonas stenophila]|uniref:Glycosyltransferase involved in cell wall biosynthesis n=1 Tax=Halomonas stenophila TaxID=795312 RepID=A0A7W5EVU5_9GAMM|nr:glycosyltransferase [Halomonas stenophila]MBB3232281.1 glycosyltransferase involved in cell wall biosynthesis [Halomonas stenophila]